MTVSRVHHRRKNRVKVDAAVVSPQKSVCTLRTAIRIAEFALLQFIAGVLIAIAIADSAYAPMDNFLSVLGMSRHPAPWIFNGAVMNLSAGLIWFFLKLASISSRARFGLFNCCGWGILSAAALMVVGLGPWDRWPFLHLIAFLSWILLLIPMSDAWWCWACEWYSSSFRCWLLNKLVLIVSIAYFPLGLMGFGPQWQKVVVACSFFWIGCFLFQLHRLIHRQQLFRIQMDPLQELYQELEFRNRHT